VRSDNGTGQTISLPISIRAIRKTYGAFAALDSVSLDIASGEFITLLGPSGSGKTTLLMVLAGFIRPDSGEIKFGDQDVSLVPPHKRNVGMVFQNYALFPHMTVAANVAYPLKLRNIGKAEAADRVARTLDLVQLAGFGDRHIDQLSGGQRQRVALARAIVFEPRILLMDEPLSALDKKLREQMQIEIRHLHQRLGMTTVYVTHDQREALTMSDRVAVIDKGLFRQVGRPRDIYERPASRFIAEFIGESNFLPVSVRDGGAHFGQRELRLAAPIVDMAAEQFLIVRPEKLRLLGANEASGDNVFDGTVKEVVYQGESSLLYITLGSHHEIAIRQTSTSANTPSAPGQRVRLALAAGDSIIVPAEARA
jgi:putative spermidine/putrescine transport system ATP-binding protein